MGISEACIEHLGCMKGVKFSKVSILSGALEITGIRLHVYSYVKSSIVCSVLKAASWIREIYIGVSLYKHSNKNKDDPDFPKNQLTVIKVAQGLKPDYLCNLLIRENKDSLRELTYGDFYEETCRNLTCFEYNRLDDHFYMLQFPKEFQSLPKLRFLGKNAMANCSYWGVNTETGETRNAKNIPFYERVMRNLLRNKAAVLLYLFFYNTFGVKDIAKKLYREIESIPSVEWMPQIPDELNPLIQLMTNDGWTVYKRRPDFFNGLHTYDQQKERSNKDLDKLTQRIESLTKKRERTQEDIEILAETRKKRMLEILDSKK